MVQTTKQNIKLMKSFKEKLKKFLSINRFIFFGSRAKGTFDDDSDFDVLIVSKDFSKTPWYKRPVQLYSSWDKDFPIEILCYTPEEIVKEKKKKWGVVREAFREGIEV